MEASKLFQYCPKCRQEIALSKCYKSYCRYLIEKRRNIDEKYKYVYATMYICPNDGIIIKREIN